MIAFSLNPEKDYVVVSIKGAPTLPEYREAIDELGKHESFGAQMHRIVDFTGASLKATVKEISGFVDKAKSLPMSESARTAFVAQQPTDRDKLEYFNAYFDPERFKIFETGRDALSWILFSDVKAPAKDSKIRFHRMLGDVSPEDVLKLQHNWFSDEAFDQKAPILWDLSNARLNIGIEEMQAFAMQMQTFSRKHRPEGRAAILVSSDFHETILKSSFQQSVELGRLAFFRAEEDALTFLQPSRT